MIDVLENMPDGVVRVEAKALSWLASWAAG